MSNLTGFSIRGLHGHRNISANFKDNKAILVGDNGIGKSSFLQILFYVISGKWRRLTEFDFQDIVISFGREKLTVTKSEIIDGYLRFNGEEPFRDIPRATFSRLKYNFDVMIGTGKSLEDIDFQELARASSTSMSMAHRFLFYMSKEELEEDTNLFKVVTTVASRIDAQVLYFPTYRKVETDLATLLRGAPSEIIERTKRHIEGKGDGEILGFGMEDVKDLLSKRTNELSRDFNESVTKLMSGFLVKVINGEHKTTTAAQDVQPRELTTMLSRTGSDILPTKTRQKIEKLFRLKSETLEEEDAIVLYFVNEMVKLYKEQTRKEMGINLFVEKCNRYFIGKNVEFDMVGFKVIIRPETGKTSREDTHIDWQNLSSGEKQIASIFARLQLKEQRYFVLIDEPELSLSIEWQKMLLPDIANSPSCAGLIAVTHSPFVFDNELDVYAQDFKVSKNRIHPNG